MDAQADLIEPADKKAGLKAFRLGRRDIFMMDPRSIIIEEGFNARDFSTPENQAHVEFLKTSIIEVGLKEPLTIRLKDNRPTLVGGESRLRAILKAIEEGHEIEAVPCQADDRYTNDAERVAEIITRNTGKSLTPLEQATVIRRLVGFGWEQAKIAKRLSLSPSNVSHMLSLLTMPEEAQRMVRQGDVSAAVALGTVREQGETNGVEVLREAVTEAKAAGRKRATATTVKRTANRMPTMKRMGMTLSAVKTESVCALLRRLCVAKPETMTHDEIRAAADKLLGEILAQ